MVLAEFSVINCPDLRRANRQRTNDLFDNRNDRMATDQIATELQKRGFQEVFIFLAGEEFWKKKGLPESPSVGLIYRAPLKDQ